MTAAVQAADPAAIERAKKELRETIERRTSLRLAEQENAGIVTSEMFISADERIADWGHNLLRTLINGQAEAVIAALRSINSETYRTTITALRERRVDDEVLGLIRRTYAPPREGSATEDATRHVKALVSAGGVDRAHLAAPGRTDEAVSAYRELTAFREGLSAAEYAELEQEPFLLTRVFAQPRDPAEISEIYVSRAAGCLETACGEDARRAAGSNVG